MPALTDFTSFDVIVALLIILFLVRGAWIGFMRQLAAFLALVGSYWIAGQYNGEIVPYVSGFVENPKLVFLICFGLLFMASAIVFTLLGKLLHRVMEITLLGWFDKLLGLMLGIVKGGVVTSFLYMFLASSLSGSNDLLKSSFSSPYLKLGAEQLQVLINDQQLREYFIPKELAIGVDSPMTEDAGQEKVEDRQQQN